ncbi:MAG TPA: hypothetical protein PLS50_00580 [Candidatus Dojkabacteria bacterium]|nr:hypothetical protein [Candidatus Dojkabacteria bacterium]
MNNEQLEKVLNTYLEDKSLEEFFEEFNLTPLEVVEAIWDEGLLDEEILERFIPSDV